MNDRLMDAIVLFVTGIMVGLVLGAIFGSSIVRKLTELNRKLAVMEAYREGRPIQYRNDMPGTNIIPWQDCSYPSPVWNWNEFDYRVKPVEPQIIWVQTINGKLYANCGSIKSPIMSGVPVIEFIELTPEVRAKLGLC